MGPERTVKALKYVLIEMHLGASNNRANEPAGMWHKGPADGMQSVLSWYFWKI